MHLIFYFLTFSVYSVYVICVVSVHWFINIYRLFCIRELNIGSPTSWLQILTAEPSPYFTSSSLKPTIPNPNVTQTKYSIPNRNCDFYYTTPPSLPLIFTHTLTFTPTRTLNTTLLLLLLLLLLPLPLPPTLTHSLTFSLALTFALILQAQIVIEPDHLRVVCKGEVVIDKPLHGYVNTLKSSYDIRKTKIEIILCKEEHGIWPTIEGDASARPRVVKSETGACLCERMYCTCVLIWTNMYMLVRVCPSPFPPVFSLITFSFLFPLLIPFFLTYFSCLSFIFILYSTIRSRGRSSSNNSRRSRSRHTDSAEKTQSLLFSKGLGRRGKVSYNLNSLS